MHFLRCPSCGAKALASASRCPRCMTAFDLVDGRGQRVKLSPCRSCEVLLPVQLLTCPWCKAERRAGPAKAPIAAALLLAAGATAFFVVRARSHPPAAITTSRVIASSAERARPHADLARDTMYTLQIGDPSTDTKSSKEQEVMQAPSTALNPAPPVVASDSAERDRGPSMPIPTTQPTSLPSSAAMQLPAVAPRSAGGDKWESATATTWVNVRQWARPDAPIVRMVKPNDVVQLGTRDGAWRLIRGSGFTGWVGARHFAVSLR
jgi:hypothetical protein